MDLAIYVPEQTKYLWRAKRCDKTEMGVQMTLASQKDMFATFSCAYKNFFLK